MTQQGPKSPTTFAATVGPLSRVPEQSPEDICKNGVDESKAIAGYFKQLTSSTNTIIEALVSVQSRREAQSFRIFFRLEKSLLLKLNQIRPHDTFRLSLRGCTMEKLKNIPRLSSLPLELTYSRGIHIEWNHRASNETETINTWPVGDNLDPTSTDAWFSSQENANTNHGKRKHGQTGQAGETDPSVRAKKSKRRSKNAQDAPTHATAESHKSSPGATQRNDQPLHCTAKLSSPSAETSGGKSPDVVRRRSRQHPEGKIKDFTLGRCPLVFGIVKAVADIRQTSSGDWMRLIHLVDPSNCYETGFKVNFFTKKYPEWLPHVALYDVLVLQDLQIVQWQGNFAGTGYHGRLKWAAFSPKKGQVYHTDLGSAPREAPVGKDGSGVNFTPFYQPTSADIQECINLSDWWRQFANENAISPADPQTQQINYLRPISRMHRLLSEAGPNVAPNGYFDCTVEVIKGHQNNQVYVLWVTDYTQNSQAATVSYNWCPRPLSDLVIPFEMWDAASSLATTMNAGEFYYIENARMKTGPSGYIEGKVVQTKIKQVFKRDAEKNPHLKALLERKRLVEQESLRVDASMTYTLLQDVQENKFFNCTVELLQISKRAKNRPCLYVTDYTHQDKLRGSCNEPWSSGMDGLVLRVVLAEEQEAAVSMVEEGGFYCMKNMRLRTSAIEQCSCVILGGSDKLIVPLNANKTDNEHLNGLLRRREQWHLRFKGGAVDQAPSVKAPPQILNIKDIAVDSTKHRINGRVVDFYPLELKDAFIQWCTRCQEDIPKQQRACVKCGDSDHEYLQYLFQLYVMVEDDNGEQIMISIDDKSSLFTGLKRGCLAEDRKCLAEFSQRAKVVLGNLTLVHSGLKSNKNIEVASPLLRFELYSWMLPKGGKAFALDNFCPVPM